MKSTGIVRKLDDLGRITLPIELRRTMDVTERDPLEIYTDGDTVVLKPYKLKCKHCGSEENVITIGDEIAICWSCAGKVAERVEKG
jgi:AbrB family transcriptional regulator, transcriptional pleiotropic regulator of transition state genes